MQALVIAAAAVLAFPGLASAHAEPGAYVIHMTEEGFEPREVMLPPGSTVAFENADDEDHWPASDDHPTHTRYAGLDSSRPVGPGEEWTFTFDREGRWEMHDHLYPNLAAVITIDPDADASANEAPDDGPGWIAAFFGTLWDAITRGWEWFLALFREEKSAGHVRYATEAPPDAELDRLYAAFAFACAPNDFSCASTRLKAAAAEHGPRVAVLFYERLERDGRIAPEMDEHQLGHQIGRATAETFGGDSTAFLLCPMSALNGGCQHGFFEYVLGKTDSSAEAVDRICGALHEDAYSHKQRFDCYHGVGHGIMMAAAYDLRAALAECDTLAASMAIDGCIQGAFMENVNGALHGEAREGVFSREDPLLPCSTLEERYRHECFINQAGWLASVAGNNFGAAAHFCLKAPPGWISSCLQSLGLMTTNPSWQNGLGAVGDSLEERAHDLCRRFPDGHGKDCIIAAVDNILNFDGLETEGALRFCGMTDAPLQGACYRTIGINLSRQAATPEQKAAACRSSGAYERECLEAAG